ncbi:hypothetical protein BCR36DRAFT_3948 [Piromyces finnis]|uniref:Uncharacterized protein n=1 Tax=Piromyces finnis TaxID=1754191 RepID=A0A1Y1VNE4_9FUNG|nr:hypothetical protein BCR36DRAFT_3948 [Piromyces finnis]|eukprot:ORX60936.1 hypothetical protein BCR36DRAFT_3948 [Piromyces finnis]
MAQLKRFYSKSSGFIILLMLFITGLDFSILTSIFPTIILENNLIKENNIYILSFLVSFLISFNVFSKSGKLINIIVVLLNISSSFVLYYESNKLLFTVSYSLKGLSIGGLLSLMFHMLANKEYYEIQKKSISITACFSLIIGSLLSILIKWINWKLLYLFSIPFSVSLLILLLWTKQINNKDSNKSYFNGFDYSGIIILYSCVFCIFLLNNATFDTKWKYYIIQFSLPFMCIIFFIITESLNNEKVILPIKANIFYLFSCCFGFSYLMDTNKQSFLIQIIHNFSIIEYEYLIIGSSIFCIFLIIICLVFRKLNEYTPIFYVTFGMVIIFINAYIFFSFNISTSSIIIVIFTLLNTIVFSFTITNLYVMMKDTHKNKCSIYILKDLIRYYVSGRILNSFVNNILFQNYFNDYTELYLGSVFGSFDVKNFKNALIYFNDIIKDVYYDSIRECYSYITLIGLTLLILLYIILLIYFIQSNQKIMTSISNKLNNVYQNISEIFIHYYDSFSDNNNCNYNNKNNDTLSYISSFTKNYDKEQINNTKFNDDVNIQNSKRNSKLHVNPERDSIFNVKYPKNFVKVYNDTMYKPVINKSFLMNDNGNLPYETDDSSKRKSFQSFVDFGKRISSIDLYSPIKNANLSNKIKSPIQTHINPLINGIYNRLSFMSSNSLPYADESNNYSSPLSNNLYLELSDMDNDDEAGSRKKENDNLLKDKKYRVVDNEQNKSYDDSYLLKKSIKSDTSFNTISNHEVYHSLNLADQHKINKPNSLFSVENKENSAINNFDDRHPYYDKNDKASILTSSSSNKSKKSKIRKDEVVFFDINKLNKYHKEYSRKNNQSHGSIPKLPLNNKNIYEKKLIHNYQESLNNSINSINNSFISNINTTTTTNSNNNNNNNIHDTNENNGIQEDKHHHNISKVSIININDIYNDKMQKDIFENHKKGVTQQSNDSNPSSDIISDSINNISSYGSSCSDIIENALNIKKSFNIYSSSLRHNLNDNKEI